MDGWTKVWVYGWVDGWIDAQMNIKKEDERKEEDEWMMGEVIDRQIEEWWYCG